MPGEGSAAGGNQRIMGTNPLGPARTTLKGPGKSFDLRARRDRQSNGRSGPSSADARTRPSPLPREAAVNEPESTEAFVFALGAALHRYGASTARIEEALARLSDRLDLDGQFFVTPTALRSRHTAARRSGNDCWVQNSVSSPAVSSPARWRTCTPGLATNPRRWFTCRRCSCWFRGRSASTVSPHCWPATSLAASTSRSQPS